METKLMLETNQTYKIYILNSQGEPAKIIVFSGGQQNKTHMSELFSDIENAQIIANQIEVLFSEFKLHSDDSIRIIKKR